MNELRHYEKVKKLSLFYDYYDYVDRDRVSADLFKDQPVKAYFVSMNFSSDSPYAVMRIRVPKRQRLAFILLIHELPNLMAKSGYYDYLRDADKILSEKEMLES